MRGGINEKSDTRWWKVIIEELQDCRNPLKMVESTKMKAVEEHCRRLGDIRYKEIQQELQDSMAKNNE